jgi:hypothetical protein
MTTPAALPLLACALFVLTAGAACTPPCEPKSCPAAGAECGLADDGCGDLLDCGACPDGLACGSLAPNRCSPPQCTKVTCAQQGASCGVIDDGCGGTLSCGACPAGQTCGANGDPNACGFGSCTPRTCEELGTSCGRVPNGCGGNLECGSCATGSYCRGGACESCGGISYASTAAPFFATNCVRCHSWAGTERLVRSRDPSRLRSVVANGSMPEDASLSAAERAPLLDWIDCGRP